MATPNRTTARQHHLVAVPLPAQGHINPLMRFCKLLALRHRFLVTFINTDSVHYRLSSIQRQSQEAAEDDGDVSDSRGRIQLAHIALPALDLTNDFRLSAQQFMEALQGMSEGLENLIRGLSPPATCLISDLLITSPTQLVADRLGIPRIGLFSSSQCSLLLHLYLVNGRLSVEHAIKMAQECTPNTYLEQAHEGQLEGLVALHKRDVFTYKHVGDDTDYMYHCVVGELKMAYERSHAIVVNSFMELEGDATQTFTRLRGNRPPLHLVGPLIEELTDESNMSLWKEDDGCMSWLDKQPPKTVLYISFGSVTLLSREQFEELLCVLESSNHRFLWAFRPDLVEGTMSPIPERFLESTCGRGHFTTWAPQLSVLKHPSVGAFLTHCGWNSSLEAIATGVPMLCWPYFFDQFLDARYIVDVWKVGMAFQWQSDGAGHIIPRGEIERCIKAVMEGEEGKTLRQNASRLQEAALKCHEKGGSSYLSMGGQKFIISLIYYQFISSTQCGLLRSFPSNYSVLLYALKLTWIYFQEIKISRLNNSCLLLWPSIACFGTDGKNVQVVIPFDKFQKQELLCSHFDNEK